MGRGNQRGERDREREREQEGRRDRQRIISLLSLMVRVR